MRKNYFLGKIMMLVLLFASFMVYGQAELVAHYQFDETSGTVAADSSGNGFDGVLNEAGTESWVEGEIDGAFEFDGSSNFLLPGTDMGLTSTLGSVAFWVNADVPDGIYTCFSAGDNSTGGGFGPENEMHVHLEAPATDIWEGGELSFYAIANPNTFLFSDPEKGNDPAVPPVNPVILTDTEWHHVAATWGKGLVKLFIDGEPIWDTTVYGPTGYSLDTIRLGSMLGQGRALVGMLDDVRIYSDVLSNDEVSDLFNKVEPEPEAVDELFADEIGLAVFPNPASEIATLSFNTSAGSVLSIDLYNAVGAKMAELYNDITIEGKNTIDINVADYNAGVYFVKLQIGNNTAFTKLIIQ